MAEPDQKEELWLRALDVINRLVRKPPLAPVLYHYTSADAALKIIQSGKIWASSARYLNDRSELQHSQKVASEVLEEEWSELGKHAEMAKFSVKQVFSNVIEQHLFVASFSAEPDLLGQWRTYCKNGRGFAVGFSGPMLSRMQGEIYLYRMEYGLEEQRSALRDVLRIYLPWVRESLEGGGGEAFSKASSAMCVPLALLLLALKHGSFRDEAEYRLIRYSVPTVPLEQLDLRATDTMIVPYTVFDLASYRGNATARAPIVKVVSGPCIDSHLAKRSLEILREKTGQQYEIDASEVPLVT